MKARSLVLGRRYAVLDVVWAESHPTDSGDPTAILATGPHGEVYELLQGNEFAKVLSVGSSAGQRRGEPTLPGVDWTQF